MILVCFSQVKNIWVASAHKEVTVPRIHCLISPSLYPLIPYYNKILLHTLSGQGRMSWKLFESQKHLYRKQRVMFRNFFNILFHNSFLTTLGSYPKAYFLSFNLITLTLLVKMDLIKRLVQVKSSAKRKTILHSHQKFGILNHSDPLECFVLFPLYADTVCCMLCHVACPCWNNWMFPKGYVGFSHLCMWNCKCMLDLLGIYM